MLRTKRNLSWHQLAVADLNLTKLVLHFAHSKRAEGKPASTVGWYSDMLSHFIRFVQSEGQPATLSRFEIDLTRAFIVHEQERGVSPYTVQARVKALKAFSSWLLAEGYTSENLLAHLKLPKVPVRIVQPLTVGEIESLMLAQNPLTSLGCRNSAILVTFLDTGLRLSELCNLSLEDSHIEEGYLKVMGKGRKERIVPIGALAQKMLWRYIFHFRPQPTRQAHDHLFLTLDGEDLQPNAVRLLLKRWGRKAGVLRLHAHLCRHTYATNFLVHQCGDVFVLKQILGHTKLDMVNQYVHWASAENMIQRRVSSPLDHLRLKGLKGYRIEHRVKKGRNL